MKTARGRNSRKASKEYRRSNLNLAGKGFNGHNNKAYQMKTLSSILTQKTKN